MVAFYNTGTISINSGSTALTGIGTEWNDNVRPGMAVEFLDEHGSFEILSVNSNTSITLGRPRVGGNLSGAPYQIVPIRGLDITNQNLLSELITDYQDVVLGIGAGLISDGTASAPALRFSADQDTGVYRIGANAFGVATAGALRFAVVGTNNFLLGGATTSAYSATNRTAVQIDGVDGAVVAFRTASTNRGYVFATADQILLEAEPVAEIKFNTLGAKPIVFGTSNVTRFIIAPTGPMLGGKTASDGTVQGVEMHPSGTFYGTSVSTFAGYFNRLTTDGSVISLCRQGTEVGSISVTTTATAYNTSSDYRLKENLEPLTGSGAFIDALNPVRGNWKNETQDTFIGLIAHEVQEVCETPVATGEKDGDDMQALAYGAPEITAHMLAELKSLRARVAALEEAE